MMQAHMTNFIMPSPLTGKTVFAIIRLEFKRREGCFMCRIDDLTAYWVGWKDTLTADACRFLNETMWMTHERQVEATRRAWEVDYFDGRKKTADEDAILTGCYDFWAFLSLAVQAYFERFHEMMS
jgi:hypothetical protein